MSSQNTTHLFKYYAFISYSRKNSKAAAYLHRQMENFRIPVECVEKEYRPKGLFLKPIFRDHRDLETTEDSFIKHVKTAIGDSRYLIVLCSPDAAVSTWVNEEIKQFLLTHDNNYNAIVPIILNGTPGTEDNDECLPQELRREEITMRNLASMIPDDGDNEKKGWNNGIIQAMSYMLKVNRKKIKATVAAEKMRKFTLYMIIGIAIAFIVLGLTAWALAAQYKALSREKQIIDSHIYSASILKKLGIMQVKNNNFDEALNSFKEALELQKLIFVNGSLNSSIEQDIANTYDYLGIIYENKREFQNALISYFEAIKIRKKRNLEVTKLLNNYNAIARIYERTGNLKNAQKYFEKASGIVQKQSSNIRDQNEIKSAAWNMK